MRRHTPKIICPHVAKELTEKKNNKRKRKKIPLSEIYDFAPQPKKEEKDRIYDIIYDSAVKMYRFTDNENGVPWIERNDVTKEAEGIFVVRFRCPINKLGEVYFKSMAKDVCKELHTPLYFHHERRYEYGIPYEECVWVIHENGEELE